MKRLTSSLLIGLGLALGISNGSFLAQPTEEFQTFTEWCENKNQLPQEIQHTIEELLKEAGTTDCNQAYQILSQLAQQSEPKQYVSSLNKAQQAYFMETGEFSPHLEKLGVGIPTETENYIYRIVMGADRKYVMATAAAKHSGLNSYTGIAYLVQLEEGFTTATHICETQQPSQVPPSNFQLPLANDEIECPPGSQSLD